MRYFMKMNQKIGIILKKIRKEKGFTQEELASKASINEKYFGRIERNQNSPTLCKIFMICNALDIKVSSFIEQIENYRE